MAATLPTPTPRTGARADAYARALAYVRAVAYQRASEREVPGESRAVRSPGGARRHVRLHG